MDRVMIGKKPSPPLQSIKAWEKTWWKLKLILGQEYYRNMSMGKLLDAMVEEFIKTHNLKVKMND